MEKVYRTNHFDGRFIKKALLTLQKIREPVEKELDTFEAYFRKAMQTKVPLLSIITNYIYRRKGKQMRPLLVFLTAGMTGSINQSTSIHA